MIKGGRSRFRDVTAEMTRSVTAFAAVFAVPDIRRVLLAFIGFNVAEWANFIAILIYAYEEGGAPAVGLVSVLQLAPAAVFAPFGATLGDRFRREVMLILAYGLFAATTFAVAAALFADWPAPVVYVLAAVNATAVTLVRPFHESLLPALAKNSRELMAAYVAGGTIHHLSVVAGPLIAGFVYASMGGSAVFIITGALLSLGTILIARIATRTTPAAEEERVIPATIQGFRTLLDSRPRVVSLLLVAPLFLLGILDVAMVVLAYEVFGTSETGTALLNSAVGVGALGGSVLTVLLIGRERLGRSLQRGLLLSGGPLLLILFIPSQAGALLAMAAVGAGMALVEVCGRVMLQRVVPVSTLSRTLGVVEGGYMAAEAIGSVIGAVLVSSLGIESAIVAAGLMLPTLGLVTYRSLVRADVGIQIPVERLHLLHASPLFAALGPAELERLAGLLESRAVHVGDVVVTQGEVGDHFYLIESGSAEVTRDGRHVADLGAGDYFGEIALLMDIPRTASVAASTSLNLLVLERGDFLATIRSYPCQLAAAESATQTRIQELGG